jgi:CTP synthase (UTP-ammonia lyase)
MEVASIGIIDDYDPRYTGHRDTGEALEAAGERAGVALVYEWVATDRVDADGPSILQEFDGLWASPGSPYRSMVGALAGIRYAREGNRPFIGT